MRLLQVTKLGDISWVSILAAKASGKRQRPARWQAARVEEKHTNSGEIEGLVDMRSFKARSHRAFLSDSVL